MLDHSLLAWIALSVGLAVTPGPDTMVVAGNAARNGLRAGMAGVAGILVGGLWYMALCGFGFLSVLAVFPMLFTIVKIAGALYLGWLGARALIGALRAGGEQAALRSSAQPFRQGLFTTALNPKVALFFLAILPQFVGRDAGAPVRGMLLIGIAYAIGAVWLSGVALVAARAGRAARQSSLMRWFEGALGTAYLALAGRMAFVRNI
ncbi:MAG: LysE family translocator [Candidatus Sphingomonas colombiensis]|nr:LysE family translocator [Sphingomonas sp.]WEK44560.1 MAG: LysE family translocator [Sphingomonas sp.]